MTIIQRTSTSSSFVIPTVYGMIELSDPLVLALIQHPMFQRLKSINQYGVVKYILPTENYSRFDHSIGVYYWLKKAKVGYEEQIAGLLHDASHTVFSHVGDYVFQEQYPGCSYQDDIHIWYLQESGLEKILQNFGLTAEQIYHKQPHFIALDQPLPILCADRLEYNLQGGLLRNLFNKNDFQNMIDSLHFEEGHWYFESHEAAKLIGLSSLHMTEKLWGAAWESLAYRWSADALRRAFEIEVVSFNEFHFSTDDHVWQKLLSSEDALIKEYMHRIQKVHDQFTITHHGQEDLLLKLKFRGIDPLVEKDDDLIPLTQLDLEYRKEFEKVKNTMEQGWPIKFHF